eukprot:IDg9059t1
MLLHDTSISGLLESVERMLEFCNRYNIKLHPAKCIIFAKEIRWCGRRISQSGFRYDPRILDDLLKMVSPVTGAHLQQFICALQWVRNGIPNFSELISPLRDFMEKAATTFRLTYSEDGPPLQLSTSRPYTELPSSSAEDFEWSTEAEFAEAQLADDAELPPNLFKLMDIGATHLGQYRYPIRIWIYNFAYA